MCKEIYGKLKLLGLIISISILFGSNAYAQTPVHNRTTSISYSNITGAITNASSGDLIEVDIGTYNETITMVSGITLRATAWTQSGVNTNTIISGAGITIGAVSDVVLQGFTVQSSGNGIIVQGSINLEIRNCIIESCAQTGIRFDTAIPAGVLIHSNFIRNNTGAAIVAASLGGNASCTISSNTIYSNDGTRGIFCVQNRYVFIGNRIFANKEGIEMRGDNCEIRDNIIYGNTVVGIELYQAPGTIISGNIIYKNTSRGIYFVNASPDSIITNNTIYSNTGSGIQIDGNDGHRSKIMDNEIYGNPRGITTGNNNDDVIIRRNKIYDSSNIGIDMVTLTGGVIEFNTIKRSGNIGIDISGTALPAFTKNNIFSNTVNLQNDSGLALVVTNHWWGSTIKTNIDALITGTGTCDTSKYRLFGKFDIAEGADTDRMPAITNVIMVSNTGPDSWDLTWTKPSITNDFVKYLIYRTTYQGETNLSSANIITQINDLNTTSFMDTNITFGTTYYYYITSLDNHPVYSNESWYSPEAIPLGPPSPPGNFTASLTPDDYESIDITWDDLLNETSYTLYKSTSITSTNFLAGLAQDTTSYHDTGLLTNTTYYYWIRSANENGESDYAISSNTTPSIAAPAAPSYVNAAISLTNVIVNWGNVANETSYTLYISTNNFVSTNTNFGISKDITNYSYAMYGYMSHYHKVRAFNIAGGSTNSPIGIAEFNVFNRTQKKSYSTITNAVKNASYGDLIEATPGTYNEAITMVSGITLRSTAWTQSSDNASTIIDGSGNANVVTFNAISNIVLQGFTIRRATAAGIYINGTIRPEVRNCKIISNTAQGIQIANANPTDILIHSNYIAYNIAGILVDRVDNGLGTISGNTICSNSGKGIFSKNTSYLFTDNIIFGNTSIGVDEQGDNNDWINNTIYNNGSLAGFYIYRARNTTLIGNSIYKNNDRGIYVHRDSRDTKITNNIIYSNGNIVTLDDVGIQVNPWDNNDNVVIVDNEIYGHNRGIREWDTTGLQIKRNSIYNSYVGIDLEGSTTSCVIELNTIKLSLDAGVTLSDTTTASFTKNNIFSNVINISNQTATQITVTNQWWGTTIASDIDAKIIGGAGGYNASNYRLFGEFDITEGADTDRLPSITWMTAYEGNGIELVWNEPSDISDLTRYQIYRSKTSGFSNLTSANVIASVQETNYIDKSVELTTNYYYYVTSMDDYPVYTNESWYSPEASSVLTALPVPINFNVSPLIDASSTNAILTWENSALADGYQISTNKLTYITNMSTNLTAYTDSTVTNLQTITYYIRATNAATNSAWLSNTIMIAAGLPSRVSNVVANYVLSDAVSLTWQNDAKAVSYLVYTNTNTAGLLSPDTNFMFPDLDPNTPYSFFVKGTNYTGVSSNYSDQLDVTTAYVPPTLTSLRVVDSTNCIITWSDAGASASGYIVAYGTNLDTSSSWTLVTTSATQTTLKTISYISQHYIGVWATNDNIDSFLVTAAPSFTNMMTAGYYAVSPLSNFTANAYATNETVLKWANADREDGYAISRGTLGNVITNLAANVTAWTDTTIFVSTNVTFYIKATNSDGYSTIVSSIASYDIPGTPVMSSNYTILSNTNVIISWTPIDLYAEGFRILTNGAFYRAVTSSVTTITDNTISAIPKTNDYQVIATNTLGASSASMALNIIVGIPITPVLDSFSANVNSITISWVNIDNAVSYMIISTKGSTNGTLSTNYVTNATSFKHTGLQAGAVYYYRLAAINALGTSQLGQWLNQATLAGFAPELKEGDVLVQSSVKRSSPYQGILHMKGMTMDTKITILNGGGDLVKSWNVSEAGTSEIYTEGEYLCIDLTKLDLAYDIHTVVLDDDENKVVRHFNYLSE